MTVKKRNIKYLEGKGFTVTVNQYWAGRKVTVLSIQELNASISIASSLSTIDDLIKTCSK